MKNNHPLHYFVGKVCTVFTNPINRNYKEECPQSYPAPLYQYFTGLVKSIDESGIFMTQVMSKEQQKSYFFMHNLVGIAEEMPLNPNNPTHAEEINKLKELNKTEREKVKNVAEHPDLGYEQGKYVSPEQMADLASQMEQTFSK